jgi:hypothetical protein
MSSEGVRQYAERTTEDHRRNGRKYYDRSAFAKARADGLTTGQALEIAALKAPAGRKWIAGVLEKEPGVREDIIERLKEKQRLLVEGITETKVAGAELNQIAAAFGVVTDRLRLYEGKSTSNVAHGHVHQLEPGEEDRIRRLLDKRTTHLPVEDGRNDGLIAGPGETGSSLPA